MVWLPELPSQWQGRWSMVGCGSTLFCRWPKQREDVAGTVGTDVFGAVFLYRFPEKGFGLTGLETVMECDGGDREAALVRVHRIGCEADQLADILRKTIKRHGQWSSRDK